MIKTGKKYFPLRGVPWGEKKTRYVVGNTHYNANGATNKEKYPRAGWVNIVADIVRPLEEKSGEYIYIDEIEGVELNEWPEGSGKWNTTIFAKVHFDTPNPVNNVHIANDIPDGFQQILTDEIPF